MNKLATIAILFFLAITSIQAHAQSPARIKQVNINADSLSKVVLKYTGKDLFFKASDNSFMMQII